MIRITDYPAESPSTLRCPCGPLILGLAGPERAPAPLAKRGRRQVRSQFPADEVHQRLDRSLDAAMRASTSLPIAVPVMPPTVCGTGRTRMSL